jgi:hypothetical protein
VGLTVAEIPSPEMFLNSVILWEFGRLSILLGMFLLIWSQIARAMGCSLLYSAR